MNASNHNIKFNYLYRDAGNYKVFGETIFTNLESICLQKIELTIRKSLIEGEFFIPEKWKIPRLTFDDYSPDLDNDYHEFETVVGTDEIPTEKRDISIFLLGLSD